MPPTLQEVRAAQAEKALEQQVRNWSDYHLAKSAAVSAERLVGSPDWDRYLTNLQALLEECTTARAMWMERCTGALSENDIRIAQLNYQACDARRKTLLEVMDLPKQLIEAAHGHDTLPRGDGPAPAGTGEPV